MIRPLTLVTMVAAMAAGMHVYQTKHEVALLDRELRQIGRAIEEQNERTLALSAEWAWLNEPERLRQAAQRHLALEPMQPTQFVRFSEFERRLPQVAAWDGPPALFAARDTGAGPRDAAGAVRIELAERSEPLPVPRLIARAEARPATPAESVPAAAEPPRAAETPAATRLAALAATALPSAIAARLLPGQRPVAEAAPLPDARAAVAPPEPPAPAPRPAVVETAAATPRAITSEVAAPAPAPRPAPVRAPVALASATAPRPVAAPRQAPDVSALPPIAGQGATEPRTPTQPRIALARPANAALAPITTAAAAPPPPVSASMLGGPARSALAPPVPHGSLPPPVPFASASVR